MSALLGGLWTVIVLIGVAFALAGVGIGCAVTVEHAAVAAFAPQAICGSAFGLLATVQAIGNVAVSAIAGTAVHGGMPSSQEHRP